MVDTYDYVTDIEDKGNLSGIENLADFDFEKFDKDIETSFQNDFLKSDEIKEYSGYATKETIQDVFNSRLEGQWNNLDFMKDTEINNEIVKKPKFELQGFGTLVELDIFQQQIIEQKEETEVTETLILGDDGNKINVTLYSGLDKSDKKQELIDLINKNDFTEKKEIIEAFAGGVEDIRKMQYKLVGKEDEYANGQTKRGVDDTAYEILGPLGTDGMFGEKSLEALKAYIKKYEIEETPTPAPTPAPAGAETNTVSSDGTASDGDEEKKFTVDKNGTVVGGMDASTVISSSVEAISNKFKLKDKYDNLKIGEYVELDFGGKLDVDDTIEIIPDWSKGSFEIDEDGKLLYKAVTEEETFRLKILKGDELLHSQSVTMIANSDEDIDQTELDENGEPNEFASIMAEIKEKHSDYQEIINAIGVKVGELRTEYIDIDQPDEEKRQPKITTLVHDLLVESTRYELARDLNKNHGRLETRLNDNCEYYIDGKYITKEKFIKKLEKGKIDPSECRFIGLDIEWDKNNETYFTDNDQFNKNTKIKSLTITDDPDFMKSKKLTKNEQIQYKAEGYVNLETKDLFYNVDSERRALKHILGIKGLFGLGGVDEDMSIATEDYDTNNPVFQERAHLGKLKRVLMRLINDENLNIKSAFEDVNKAYEKGHNVDLGDKDLNKLLEMYTIYRDNADGMIAGGDYFQKAMGLLDNYFIKGIKGFDDDNSVLGIYGRERIGRVNGLIDPDKQKKAVRKLFKGEYSIKNKDGDEIPFQGSKQLRELKRIIKKVDLVDFFNGGKNSGGKYDEFDSLYEIYKTNEKNDLDENGNVVVVEGDSQEALYYNAVFDFLVGIGEGQQDIVDAVNSMRVLENGITANFKSEIYEKNSDGLFVLDNSIYRRATKEEKQNSDLDKFEYIANDNARYKSLAEKEFVLALADLRPDGRNDFGDRGLRMGLEIKNIWKSVAVDAKYIGLETKEGGSDTVYGNLIEFAKYYMEKTGQNNLLSDLDAIDDVESMVSEIKTNSGLLNSLKNMLVNSPIPMDYILRYGKDASEKYLESDKADILSKVLTGKVTIDGLEQKLDEEIQKLVRQGLDIEKIPEIMAVLKPMFYGAIVNNGGVGAGLTLNTAKIGSFSLNLGAADVPGQGMSYGVTMSWAKSVALSESTTLNTRTSVGTAMLFVPIVSQSVGVSTVFNKERLNQSLKAKTIKKISAGANVTMVAGMPSRGLSAGFSKDKIEGINLQYNNIKDKLSGGNGILAAVLSGINMDNNRDNLLGGLEEALAEKLMQEKLNNLGDSDRLLVAKAAKNLYQGLMYYDIEGVLDKDDPRFTTIVHDMAENYALQWKNEAMAGASKVRLDSVGVGVQFLAGYFPMPMVTASIAWNKNMYSTETSESVANYYAQLSTGAGMMNIKGKKGAEFLSEDGKITNNAVEYLNTKMSIAHPNIDVSDLDIEISEYHLSNVNGEGTEGPKSVLRIPKSLYKYVNINISSDVLANVSAYVGDGDTGEMGVEYIEVPLNAKIALLDYSRTNAGKFNLIIGDTKAEMGDLKIGPNTNMENLTGNPTLLKNKKRVYMEEAEINNELENLGSVELNDNGVFKKVEHPIEKCDSVNNGLVTFDLKSSLVDTCIDMGGMNSALKIDKIDNKLVMPQFGTLTMYSILDKNGDIMYEMYYSSSPSDKLNINFDVAGYMKSSTNWIEGETETDDGVEWKPYTKDFKDIDVFDKYDYLDRAFDNIEEKLSKMDDGNGEYATFMKAAFDAGIGDVLDYSDYNDSFDALKKILNGKLSSDTQFDELKNKINSVDISDEEKLMIVDRFKAIFSFHPQLTNLDNDGAYLMTKIDQRKKLYEKLKGYDAMTGFPLVGKKYREKVSNVLKGEKKLEKIEKKNLFGMTAFYRHDNTAGRGYSMTQMGSTNVLGGHMETIEKGDLPKTQERFWNNLDESSPHKDILIKSLVEKIGEDFVTEKIIEENLENLLKGEEIDILLTNDKKRKMQLDLNYVFYLLGECANESIGVELEGVKISEKIQDGDDDGAPDIEEGRWDVEGGSDRISIDGKTENLTGGIYANGVDSFQENQWAGEGGFGVGVAATRFKDSPEDIEMDNQYPEGGVEEDNQYTEDDNQYNG